MDDEPLSAGEWVAAIAMGAVLAGLLLWAAFCRLVRRPKVGWP
jgi:hypothetical protein